MNIPTAEEFSKNYTRLRSSVALKDLSDFAINFAALHVQAALKEASEKVKLRIIPNNENTYFEKEIKVSNFENNEQTIWVEIEKPLILNAYSLKNIK